MTRKDRVRYEMFVRVRDFWAAHHDLFPEASTAGKAFTAVAAAMNEIEQHATAKLLSVEDGAAGKAARDAIVERLTTIARTARAIAKDVPGADKVFKLPKRPSEVVLLTTARAFIRSSQAAKEKFVNLGMPETFVTDLQEQVDRFEQAVRGRRAGRSGLAAAQAAIDAATAGANDAIRILDVVVANTLADDPVLLPVWERHRRVNPKAKPAKSAGEPTAIANPQSSAPTATPAMTTTAPAIAETTEDPLKRAS